MEELYDINFTALPWSHETFCSFIVCCATEKLKHATVKSYLSQVRSLHHLSGLKPVQGYSTVHWLLMGLNNSNVQSRRRIAVSPYLMRVLKIRLKNSKLEVIEKLLLWSIMSLLFHGALRSSEILSPTANEHSDTTQTWSDVQWGLEEIEADSSVILKLKSPKEVTGLGSIKVEIFGCFDRNLCPVNAFRTWMKRTMGSLVFQFESGKNITGDYINKMLTQ